MGVGNSGQWFSNKNDAIAYYNSKISYWGNLWETEQIDDSTYYKLEENRIRLLDYQKQVIKGKLEEMYILKKQQGE